jgi:acyl carrier protein
MFDQRQDRVNIQALVLAGVLAKVRAGQFEQGGGRTEPVLLQVNERARQLDQSLVKSAVGAVPIFEPKLFQNIVRLIILPAIEAVKITLIIGIKPAVRAAPNHARDSFVLVAHHLTIAPPVRNPILIAVGRRLRLRSRFGKTKFDMTNTEELKTQIKSMLVEDLMLKIGAEEIADDQPLFGPRSLGLDSVDALQLVVALDKTYGLKISDAAKARAMLGSVNAIAAAIEAHQAAKGGR